MLSISPETMLLIGALCGAIGFFNVFLIVVYTIKGVLFPPSFDKSKIKKHTDEEWPSDSSV
jgi:hypothetical protein